MFKNLFVLVLLLASFVASAQDLKEIRLQYPEAINSSEITAKIDGELSFVSSGSNPILSAYKGAVLTLRAKFAKDRKDKKEFFKEGVSLIENAIKADGSNVEIRYLRLSVQENSPKFLGYHKNIKEDKEFILKNYSPISSKNLKSAIKDYVLNSESFSEEERSLFQL